MACATEKISAWLFAILATVALSISSVHGAELSAPLTAIWRMQQLELVHEDDRTFYSCAQLVRRTKVILNVLGAHVASETRTRCITLAPGVQSLLITFLHPVEATEENVREASQWTAAQQLRARVRGETLPAAEDLERFPAAWRTVALHRVRGLRIDNSDCALLETIREQIFPHLAIQIPAGGFLCSNGVATLMRPRVIARALVPVAMVSRYRT
jgi:hypothetical protein